MSQRPSQHDEDLQVALAYWFDAERPPATPLGEGHINSTWRVRAQRGDFVLQRISQSVFPNPPRIAANLEALFALPELETGFPYKLPRPLPDRHGNALVRTAKSGSYWRLCRYFGATRTLQSVARAAQARAAGLAFGRFQQLTRAIEPTSLSSVIDGFQRLDLYWRALARTVEVTATLSDDETALVAELGQHQHLPQDAEKLFSDAGRMTGTCVIHGDCKVNNLLFAPQDDDVVAVLDLDTLMAGPWWLDFGDLVRSAAYDAGGEFSRQFYAEVAQGFFAGRGKLHVEEVEEALRAPAHISFMLSVRFLDDHLRGDRYFRVSQRGENLARSKSQFQQYLQLQEQACRSFMEETLQQLSLAN